jgi:hypothetical protein
MTVFLFVVTFHFAAVSSVGIATGYGLDRRWVGVRVLLGAKFFFVKQTVSEPYPEVNIWNREVRSRKSKNKIEYVMNNLAFIPNLSL